MEATPRGTIKEPEETTAGSNEFAPVIPGFFPAYVPLPYPYWSQNKSATLNEEEESRNTITYQDHQILKPTPVIPKQPVNLII